jgi:hypothetical protein
MARKSPSRLDKRREAEAVEAREKDSPEAKKKGTTRKKAAKRKTTPRKKKVKAAARERLVWAVFGGNMKEEARFPYDQRAEADAKVELLRSKSKKLYFVQPIKEGIEGPAPRPEAEGEEE